MFRGLRRLGALSTSTLFAFRYVTFKRASLLVKEYPRRTHVLLPVSLALVGFTTSRGMAEAVRKCDVYYAAGDMQEAYEEIAAFKELTDPEVQWRYARMIYKVAEKTGVPADKEQGIKDGLVILRKNLENAPKCPNTHKWIAILLGSKDKHESFKAQIEEAFVIKDHLLKSLEFNPNDGYTHYVLGKWCFQVAGVGWAQKKIAATLFASPPESSYEEALEHLKDAERLKPDIFNQCYLLAAKCLLQIGDKPQAEKYLKKCVALSGKDDESATHANEAKQIAKKNGMTV